VEQALAGKKLDADTIAQAAEHAGEGMDFLGDIFASEEYRQHQVKVYTKRAHTAALETPKEGRHRSAPCLAARDQRDHSRS
jgi:carbon-monoxide dehydrogenase medium subunit